jgi:hypothetical protein
MKKNNADMQNGNTKSSTQKCTKTLGTYAQHKNKPAERTLSRTDVEIGLHIGVSTVRLQLTSVEEG